MPLENVETIYNESGKDMMKRLSLMILFCAMVMVAQSQSFEVDGIAYNVTSYTELTVEVASSNSYSGDIVIPANVSYEGTEYRVTAIGDFAFFYSNGAEITSVTLPETIVEIGAYAFYDCSTITSFVIPNGVTTIGNEAFSGCSSLTSIDIPNSVVAIGVEAFGLCYALASVNIPESVIEIGGNAFLYTPWYDSQLNGVVYINKVLYQYKGEMPSNTSIDVKNGTVSISDYAFSGCSNLTSITLPEGLTSIGFNSFYRCVGLAAIRFPESLTSIGNNAFYGCSKLESVAIPENLKEFGWFSFQDCSSLATITLPERVTQVGRDAFDGTAWYNNQLDGLTYLNKVLYKYKGTVLPDTRVAVKEGTTSINAYAFFDCDNLVNVIIPKDVKEIGQYAFKGCSDLSAITCEATTAPSCVGFSALEIDDLAVFDEVDKTIPVYVPMGSSDDYEQAEYWCEFTNICSVFISSEVYFRNVATGKFLTAANNWGTQASLGESGLDVKLKHQFNGRYTIETGIRNSVTDHYFGANLYMDAGAAEWWVESQPSGYYTLSLDGVNYIGSDGGSVVVGNLTNSADERAQWQVLTKEDLIAELKEATQENPMNATFFIQGANFSRNDERNSAWQGEVYIDGNVVNYCAERWDVTAFDVHQILDNLPNGLYELRAQGFYREGGQDNTPNVAANNYAAGASVHNAYLYANDVDVPINSIMSEAKSGTAPDAGFYSTSLGYVPQNMEGASSFFSEGLYQNSLFVMVSDGTLRIGIRKDVESIYDWACFDNFELYYYGATIELFDSQESFSHPIDERFDAISYTRNFRNTNWQALYVPFDILVTEEFLSEFEVAYVNNVHQRDYDDDGDIDNTEVEAFKIKKGTLRANYPYLIRAKEVGEKTIAVSNTILYAAEENSYDCSSMFDTYTFTGTYRRLSSDMLPQSEGYYALSGGKWKPVAEGSSLGAFRYYLHIKSRGGDAAAKALSIRMIIFDEYGNEEITEVEEVEANLPAEDVIYDLHGRRVELPEKGVYIVNGKKMVF